MKFAHRVRRDDLTLELTPLIDVVFLLLIFFMVATTFAVTAGIDVKLPASKTSRIEKRVDKVEISVTRDGAMYFNSDRVTYNGLLGKLRATHAADPETLVVIRADMRVQHGDVFSVMEAVRAEGLLRIAVAGEATGAP